MESGHPIMMGLAAQAGAPQTSNNSNPQVSKTPKRLRNDMVFLLFQFEGVITMRAFSSYKTPEGRVKAG
jgi:hypothetical protein